MKRHVILDCFEGFFLVCSSNLRTVMQKTGVEPEKLQFDQAVTAPSALHVSSKSQVTLDQREWGVYEIACKANKK